MSQITLVTGPERRRRWSDEDKQRILEEAFGPGGNAADAARRHDVSNGLIYTWRAKARALTAPGAARQSGSERASIRTGMAAAVSP